MSKDKKISYKDLEEKLLQPEDALLNDLSKQLDVNIPDSILITSGSNGSLDCSSSSSSKSCSSSFSTSG